MASYPDFTSVAQEEPYREEIEWKTLISQFDEEGEEQRKQKWLYPKRNVTVRHAYITKAKARTIWQFYNARAGGYEAFNYYVPFADAYVSEYVGIGDATTTGFNLPCKDITTYTVFIGGSSIAATVATGAGADGADHLRFSTPPADGAKITMSFTGRLKIRCRFAEDNLGFEQFYNDLVTIGIKLKGLLNE
jgi:hypothetical protein